MRLARYAKEVEELKELGLRQLNLEKNRIKEDFEKTDIKLILMKFMEEFHELGQELFWNNLKTINYDAVFSELGDCMAVLTGIYAWVKNYIGNREAIHYDIFIQESGMCVFWKDFSKEELFVGPTINEVRAIDPKSEEYDFYLLKAIENLHADDDFIVKKTLKMIYDLRKGIK